MHEQGLCRRIRIVVGPGGPAVRSGHASAPPPDDQTPSNDSIFVFKKYKK